MCAVAERARMPRRLRYRLHIPIVNKGKTAPRPADATPDKTKPYFSAVVANRKSWENGSGGCTAEEPVVLPSLLLSAPVSEVAAAPAGSGEATELVIVVLSKLVDTPVGSKCRARSFDLNNTNKWRCRAQARRCRGNGGAVTPPSALSSNMPEEASVCN
mgnify:CR=1 FL=1